jgi:hypothetical protein
VEVAKQGLGQALAVAANPRVPGSVAQELVVGAKDAFVFGLHRGVIVGAVAAFLGALIVFRWLPSRERPSPDEAVEAPIVADVALQPETVA